MNINKLANYGEGVNGMNEKLLNLIKELQSSRKLETYSEEATKQAVVLKILAALGWDPFEPEEVYPEYSIRNGGRVDYSLRYNGINKVFIEVKKISEDLERHQEQLLNYSFHEGVKLAILTNGISWWFYLPLREGSWEQRKFYTIEIYEQDAESIAENFEKFLSKENVISGKTIEFAENVYKSKQKKSLIERTLPKAWEKIITEPDEQLVELLADTTEKICGYRPDSDTVAKFIHDTLKSPPIVHMPTQDMHTLSPKKIKSNQKAHTPTGYTGKSITAFVLDGKRYSVKSWREMLLKVSELMYIKYPNRFEDVLTLVGRKRPYFSKNPNELRIPGEIRGTGIYVETHLNSNNCVKLTKKVLALFGYPEDALKIETRD